MEITDTVIRLEKVVWSQFTTEVELNLSKSFINGQFGLKKLSVVDKTIHTGIVRAKSHEESIKEPVSENIKKARRTLYSLMSSGVHAENGLGLKPKYILYADMCATGSYIWS